MLSGLSLHSLLNISLATKIDGRFRLNLADLLLRKVDASGYVSDTYIYNRSIIGEV